MPRQAALDSVPGRARDEPISRAPGSRLLCFTFAARRRPSPPSGPLRTGSRCAMGGLVRITLKRPFNDGTFAVDLDPLSLLSRLAASVPAPGFNTVRYGMPRRRHGGGVLAPAAHWRPLLIPPPCRNRAWRIAEMRHQHGPAKRLLSTSRRPALRVKASIARHSTFGFNPLKSQKKKPQNQAPAAHGKVVSVHAGRPAALPSRA